MNETKTFKIDEIAGLTRDIPAGAWVAISERLHKVLAYGIDLPVVVGEARELGEDLPLIVRVPEQSHALFV
jgi:hypothetical protein